MSVVLLSACAALVEMPSSDAAYVIHSPILIRHDIADGDSGITGGTGTELDPYIIEGWQIEHFDENCIDIQDSNKHYLIRNVYVRPSPDYQYHAQYGIHIEFSSNVTVENCLVENNEGSGIMVYGSRNIRIVNNELSNNLLYFGNCEGVSAEGNRLYSSPVAMYGSKSVNLASNAITNSGSIVVDGYCLEDFSTHDIADTNTIDGQPVHYYKNLSSLIIDQSMDGGEVIIANCSGVRVSDINLAEMRGFTLAYAEDVAVSNVQMYNSQGMQFRNTTGLEISNCSYSETGAIVLSGARDVSIFGCLMDGEANGIELHGSTNVSIVACNVTSGHTYGVMCYWSTDSTVQSCTFGNCYDRAVFLHNCAGMAFYHNNMGSNSIWDTSEGTDNAWDNGYPAGGNYWANFKGYDNCSGPGQDIDGSDGISDRMYWYDSYPLMEPYAYQHPRAAFTIASVDNSTKTYSVNASGCWDPADTVSSLEVRWDWSGDGEWDTPWSISKTAEHHYSEPGNYTVFLEVRNSQGLSSITFKDVVVNGIPWTTYLLYAIMAVILMVALTISFLLLRRSKRPPEDKVPQQ